MSATIVSSNTNSANADSLVITKPTGLSVGDLMVCNLTCNNSSTSIDLPAGWTSQVNTSSSSTIIRVIYKIAEAADASASDFTFTGTGGISRFNGCLMRVTGHNPTTPIDISNSNTDASSFQVTISTITPSRNNNLFILGGVINTFNESTFSYSMVTDNPTWTSIQDATLSSGLDSGTAWASRNSSSATGNIIFDPGQSFTNASAAIVVVNTFPFVTVTTEAASYDITSATLNGTIVDDGGFTVSERGFVYAKTTNPTIANTKVTVSGTVGSYSKILTGLESGTTYYVKAFGTNSYGIIYGNEISFTTATIANNQVIKDISGVSGQTYAVRLYVGGTIGTLTVKLGSTGYSQTFNAGAGYVTLQGLYGGLSGLIFESSGTFNGYVDDVSWVIILGEATIDWNLDSLTNLFPINSSVLFKRLEDKDFNRFRIYRILDIQFKDLDAYVTVELKKEANEGLTTDSKQFLVSNTSSDTLPFINKKLSMLTKNQAIRIGVSNNSLNETFTICQLVIKGFDQSQRTFDGSKIINIV